MGKITIILALILLSFSGFSQATFKEVDSTSYSLYMSGSWSSLTVYGESVAMMGYDYYYLNLRIAIAYYNLKNYSKSERYFNRALKNSATSDVANEYLFWIYYLRGKELDAYYYYQKLSPETKARMTYKPSKMIAFFSVEGGNKFSNDKNIANDLSYGNIAFQNKFSPQFRLLHSITYLSQDLIWGDYSQFQYLIQPSYKLNNNTTATMTLHYANYNANFDYLGNYLIEPTQRTMGSNRQDSTLFTKTGVLGSYKEQDLLLQFSYRKTLDHFTFAPHAGVILQWESPTYEQIEYDSSVTEIGVGGSTIIGYTIDSTLENHNTPITSTQVLIGADINYHSEKFMVGADIFYSGGKETKQLFFVPYINLGFSENFSLFAYYLRKGETSMVLFDGTQLLNTRDESTKFSLTGTIKISYKTSLSLTYQNEKVLDFMSGYTYNFNTAFLGLKIKL